MTAPSPHRDRGRPLSPARPSMCIHEDAADASDGAWDFRSRREQTCRCSPTPYPGIRAVARYRRKQARECAALSVARRDHEDVLAQDEFRPCNATIRLRAEAFALV